MDVNAVYDRGPNLVIQKNKHQLVFLHQCMRCGRYFRALDPLGNEIPTTQDERNRMAGQIDNIRYTDSHGICEECFEELEKQDEQRS